MIRHYLALIFCATFALVSLASSLLGLWAFLNGLPHGMLASLGAMFCFGCFIHAAEQASAKIVREKTRRNFIAG